MYDNLPDKKYQVILADPPWKYTGSETKWGAAEKFYKTLTPAELSMFPLDDVMARPAVVFMWATCPKINIAIETLESWGLHFRGIAFVWVKTSAKTGEPWGARGVRPSIVKPLSEMVIVGATKREGKPLPIASESVVQTIFAPVGKHSAKPPQVQERIEELYPDYAKLELFGRGTAREGWDIWGNEAE